jgi:hypothetical protein
MIRYSELLFRVSVPDSQLAKSGGQCARLTGDMTGNDSDPRPE